MDEFEYRGDKKEPKKKFDFKKRKDNTVKSLFEIEHFLRDFKQVAKGIKFYKVFVNISICSYRSCWNTLTF